MRGRASDEALAALREELEVEVVPEPDRSSTAIQGWLPDQAALYGVLARMRQLGLELLEVRRLPGQADGGDVRGSAKAATASSTSRNRRGV